MPPVSEKQRRQIIVTAGLDPAVHLLRENFFAMDARVVSAFTRVHSPSKTGVNALNDALCAGTTR